MPNFSTNVNKKKCQYAHHIIYQHNTTILNSFTKQKKVHQISKLPTKRLKNRVFCQKSPLYEAKIYRHLSIIGQKFIEKNSSDYRDFNNDNLSITRYDMIGLHN
jgi:hypothetical protein